MNPQQSHDEVGVDPTEEPRGPLTTAVQRRIEERSFSLELDELDRQTLASRESALDLEEAAFGATVGAHLEPLALPVNSPWAFALETLTQWVYNLRVPARVGFLGFAVYLFAFNLSVVRGSSMAPGIHDGDRILIDQFSYVFSEVERGDIVVLRYPLDPSVDYIKRVVGLPGDEIVMAGGSLWVNGERVVEDYINEADHYTHTFVRVKPEHVFVLGDNRLHSSDSREFGQVAQDLLRGKVDLRLWPLSRIGRLR